jgi:hypothetical protein
MATLLARVFRFLALQNRFSPIEYHIVGGDLLNFLSRVYIVSYVPGHRQENFKEILWQKTL